MIGAQTQLKVCICKDANDAIQRGYYYHGPGKSFKPVEITEVVIVNNATEAGKPTVDFIMQDQSGNKYVVMLTAALLKSLPL